MRLALWSAAFSDGVIRASPLDRLTNVKRDQDEDFADPFTLRELERIQIVTTMRQQDINMVMFASQMLSNYVSLEWVARQLGHVNTTMVKRHYARWIQNDTPNMADKVSEILGFGEDIGEQKNPDFAPILPQKLTSEAGPVIGVRVLT